MVDPIRYVVVTPGGLPPADDFSGSSLVPGQATATLTPFAGVEVPVGELLPLPPAAPAAVPAPDVALDDGLPADGVVAIAAPALAADEPAPPPRPDVVIDDGAVLGGGEITVALPGFAVGEPAPKRPDVVIDDGIVPGGGELVVAPPVLAVDEPAPPRPGVVMDDGIVPGGGEIVIAPPVLAVDKPAPVLPTLPDPPPAPPLAPEPPRPDVFIDDGTFPGYGGVLPDGTWMSVSICIRLPLDDSFVFESTPFEPIVATLPTPVEGRTLDMAPGELHVQDRPIKTAATFLALMEKLGWDGAPAESYLGGTASLATATVPKPVEAGTLDMTPADLQLLGTLDVTSPAPLVLA